MEKIIERGLLLVEGGVFSELCDGCGKLVQIGKTNGKIRVENPECVREPGYCLKTEVEIRLRKTYGES